MRDGGSEGGEVVCLRGETVENRRDTAGLLRILARHEGHNERVKSRATASRDMLTLLKLGRRL